VPNPGYPWWLTAAVLTAAFAALLWYVLGGWERPWLVTPLAAALSAVCALATLLTAMALSLALSEPAETPPPPARTEATEVTDRAATPQRTGPSTTARPAPTVASPPPSAAPSSASASASATASASASAGARTP
jgi:hypothetical protein